MKQGTRPVILPMNLPFREFVDHENLVSPVIDDPQSKASILPSGMKRTPSWLGQREPSRIASWC
jgi:hypothetical protein